MKILFFLVALANVALALWETSRPSDRVTADSPRSDYSAQDDIVLMTSGNQKTSVSSPKVREPSGVESETVSVPHSAASAENEAPACLLAGPFSDKKISEIWRQQLQEAGDDVEVVVQAQKSVKDYLVYYPATGTAEESADDLQMIRNLGFTDAWMLSESDNKGYISLGVFNKESKAVEVKSRMAEGGLSVEVKPRYKSQPEHFVQIRGGSQSRARLALLKQAYSDVSISQVRVCKDP